MLTSVVFYSIMYIEGKGKGLQQKKKNLKKFEKHLTEQKLYDIMNIER